MEIAEMRRIPIVDFLLRLGHSPVKRRASEHWYLAPYRNEKEPSFRVNADKNVWYDFGLGRGGDIFSLAGELIQSRDFLQQAQFISEAARVPFQFAKRADIPKRKREPSFEDIQASPLGDDALKAYLKERCIPMDIALRHCIRLDYTLHGKRYFAVGFRNVAGGYEIRNRFFKGCIPPKEVSVIRDGLAACNVYEGFMDFLSALTLGIGNGNDHLVLNSVSNVEKAMRYLKECGRINCYLDNDDAGRRTVDVLRTHYGERVTDCSPLYKDCKDLNEYLQQIISNNLKIKEK